MKAALITEEQIKDIMNGIAPCFKNDRRIAIDVLNSLKVQEPVAWKKTAEGVESTRNQQLAERLGFNVPLYAGEQP